MINLFAIVFAILGIKQYRAQYTVSSANISAILSPYKQITPLQDSSSPFYPNDYFVNIQYSNQHIYSLCSNNIIQIWNSLNIDQYPNNITTYSYSNNTGLKFISMSLNIDSHWLSIASYTNSTLKHVIYNIVDENNPIL